MIKWDLDPLYTSFDSDEYIADKKNLNEKIEEFNSWSEGILKDGVDPVDVMETYIKLSIETDSLISRLVAFSSLTLSTEATNERAQQENEGLRMKFTDLTLPYVRFQKFIKEVENLEEVISKSELLQEHAFVLGEIKSDTKYMLSEGQEIVMSKMRNTGSAAWSNLQEVCAATLLVDIEIDGEEKELPLPTVRNFAHSPNKDLRKTAYEAELESYKKIENSSAAALNGIKGEVITNAELRGYKSALDMTLIDSRLQEETLKAMLEAMEESFPDFRRYYRAKAKYLGHEAGLPFYDLFAPVGSVEMKFSYEEAQDYVIKNFRTFSDELADFAKEAFDNNWIDVTPREGKRGGAFCYTIHPIKESRILTNFDGSLSDVLTLAHELGHGYHGSQLREESILNTSYPMPIAETASIFCETIVLNAALNEANDEEKLTILEQALSDDAQTIVDISSRYIFETELFKRREKASLSVNELKEIMLDAQRQTYGDGLDENFLHPYMWVNKTHYYSAGRNFYNFPYAFGMLFAKGLYAKYLEDKQAFLKNYNELLRATGKKSIEDVAMMMDIDVKDKSFFKGALDLIAKDIDEYISIVEKL